MSALRVGLLAGIVTLAACSADGCPGTSTPQGEFPASRRLDRPLRFRLTSQGAQFLGDKAVEILRKVLGSDDTGAVVLDLARFDMGAMDIADLGSGVVALRDVVLAVDVAPEQVSLVLVDSPGRFIARVEQARISLRQGVLSYETEDGDLDSACRIADGLDTDDPLKSRVGSVTVEVVMEPFVNEFGRPDARIDIPELTLHDMGVLFPVDCQLSECTDGCAECRVGCPLLSGSAAVADALFQEAPTLIADMVRTRIRDNVVDLLESAGGGPIDVEIHPSAIFGDRLPTVATARPLRAMLSPSIGGVAVTSDVGGLGVDALFDAGVDALPHRCVSPIASEPVHTFGPPPQVEQSTDLVHFVLAVAGGAIDASVWAAYKSGLLCMALSSAEIADLSDGSLALTSGGLEGLLPGISSLAGPNAPLLVTLEPGFDASDFPLVRVETRPDGSPQFTLSLRRVGLSLHAAIDGRMARVIGLEATAEIKAGLVALPDALLSVTLDGVDIEDLHVTYEEMLPGRDISALAGFISGAIASGLLTDLAFPLAAPEVLEGMLGSALELDIRSVRADGLEGDWLAARGALIEGRQAVAGAATRVEGLRPTTPFGVAPRLGVPAQDGSGRALEYQVRMDHLPWTSFTPGRLPDLSGPHWRVYGDHRIEIRARHVGSPGSLDGTPWWGDVRVNPPRRATPPSTRGQEPDVVGCAQSPAASAGLPLPLAPWLRRGGALTAAWGLLSSCEDDAPDSGTCETTADCPPRHACSRSVCVPAPACADPSACCPGQACLAGLCQDPPACDPEHCGGPTQTCEGGWCVRTACIEDAQCAAGLRCVGGRCVQGVPCDGRCAAGEVCHARTTECRPPPAACAGMTCPQGQLLHVVDPDGGLLGGGCGWDEASCECVPSPPLQPGDVGRWGSVGLLDGRAVAAAYDATYADLVWLAWEDDGEPVQIHSVAGVPLDQPPVAAEDGYRGGIAHPGPRTGRYAALVVTSGIPLVAHRNDTTRALDAAVHTGGAWTVHIVDDVGDAGYANAGALLEGQIPALAYAAQPSPDRFEIRFVEAKAPAPRSSADWRTPTVIAPVGRPLAEIPSIDVDARAGVVAVAWAEGGRVELATSEAGGAFRSEVVVDAGAGPDVAVAVDDQGIPAVVYRLPTQARLMVMVDGATHELDDGAGQTRMRAVGAWPAAGWISGELVVAYQDPYDGDLWIKRGIGPSPAAPLATQGALGFHNDLLLEGPGGRPFVYTTRLGFDAAGRSLAGPLLTPLAP